MDKEKRRRAAYRTIIQPVGEGVAQGVPVDFTVRVSGQEVELELEEDPEGEYTQEEDFRESSMWHMSLDTLKRFIQAAQWCIEKSEAFEKSHPVAPELTQVED